MGEELRVLLAAAEIGRADIINKAVEALTAGLFADAPPGEADNEERRIRILSFLRSDGASALHISSMNGHIDACRALLRLGASPEMPGAGPLRGKNPWDVATTAVKQVYANELFSQVAHGEEAKVLALLRAGVSANFTDGGPRSDTPLHWAAGGGHLRICSILLQYGADLNGCNSEGASALHEASKGGHASVVSSLLQQGANPNAVGTGGLFDNKTPLQVSSTEAVSEALRSSLPLLPSVQPPVGAAAPIPGRELSGGSEETHLPGTRDDSGSGEGEKSTCSAERLGGHARYRVEQGSEGPRAEERKRESDRERVTPSTASGAPRGAVGDGGGNQGQALPMLWPPPRSCSVFRGEVCRIPAHVVVVLPTRGVAGPGTLILRTLQAAFVSHGVTAICTRERCPPGRGNEFFVTLACGGLQGACASSSSGGCGQGFSVVVGSGMVKVAGTGEPGLYYGVRALCQLLRFYALPLSRESSLEIPCCILRDEPDVVRRSLIVDVRYPLVPTLPSLMRTLEAASRSRINVIQLTVTRETASWLAEQGQRGTNQTSLASRGAGISGGVGDGDRPDDMHEEEGAWGWGALGAIEAFCRDHFMELVLGWMVVPGDESREAQRAAVQLLSPLSQQFQSNEVHIVFEEDVQLTWEGNCNGEATPEPTLDQAEEGTQPEGNIGGVGRRQGSVRRLSSKSESESESGGPRSAAPTATGTTDREGLSLTRFLSNVVVACGQGTVVLDGVPSAAIASLQGAGYLPVEMAFSLGTDALSDNSFATLFGDGVIDARSDELSVLLGPVHLGYVCAGHRGSGSGICEEASLSIRGALEDVARAVAIARRTRSGMQLRVSPTMASGAAVPSPAYPSTAVFAAGTTGSICDGASLYYPALLSDALEFFGAGLCWRLDKASIALHLPAHDDRGAAVWGSEEDVSQPTAGEVAGNEGVLVIRAPPLHGASDPTILLMAHVLQTDAWKMEEISAGQLSSCLRMLVEEWNPFSVAEGNLGCGNDEEMAMRNLNTVLWAMHAPGGNDRVQFYVDDDTRFVLKALQRRFLSLEKSSILAHETVEAIETSAATDARPSFLDIHRAARLLKISGRLLQATSNQIRRPDQRVVRGSENDACPTPPSSAVPSPSSGPRPGDQHSRDGRAWPNSPHANGSCGHPQGTVGTSNGCGSGYEGTSRNLGKVLAQLPSPLRLDFANRYLEEFRVFSSSWDSTKNLSTGKMVLHASLSGLLKNLAHDESATQMEGLCKSTIYTC